MIAAPAISAAPPDDPVLDWSALVDEGRALLGAMSDGRWTDFNVHDPGITILELFAYALTDLGYRAAHAMPDLLAGSAALLGPAAGLTTRAVTPDDLRRLGLDVAGVRNLWLEPGTGPGLRLAYSPGTGEIAFGGGGEAVRLEGVHRVLIEKASQQDLSSASLARAVALRLHAERNLCEDFEAFAVLEPQPVVIVAELEIDDAARADAVLLDILARLDAYVSPRARRRSVAELRAEGLASDAIYDGPALERGVSTLPPGRSGRILHLSDVIAELAQAPGVRATRRVRLGRSLNEAESGPLAWSLAVEDGRTAAFDVAGSRIRLRAAGAVALDSVLRPELAQRFADSLRDEAGPVAAMREPPPPSGRDRRLADYRPLRFDLPLAYGVQPGALGRDAAPARRAQANQLRGYLAMFDTLLAAQFAQLAGAQALMAAELGDGRSYFAPALELAPDEAPVLSAALDQDALQRLVEVPGSAEAAERRARFLGHMLARFGESAPSVPRPPGAPDEAGGADRLVQTRAAFLRAYPKLSAGRGAGANLLVDGDESPLLERIRLKLGLPEAAAGQMLLIEHILLRGVAQDDAALPLLAAAAHADPYSRQISFVVDTGLDARPGDRDIVARVVREECPAHIVAYLHWLPADAFAALAQHHARWMAALRRARREELGLAEAPA
ncbi:MAG TPA: hypothetical protein VLA00_13795 [Xanthobacteraceae bacterium]|nr:hypothetical protein [Xanthobacteraceae bacterium]